MRAPVCVYLHIWNCTYRHIRLSGLSVREAFVKVVCLVGKAADNEWYGTYRAFNEELSLYVWWCRKPTSSISPFSFFTVQIRRGAIMTFLVAAHKYMNHNGHWSWMHAVTRTHARTHARTHVRAHIKKHTTKQSRKNHYKSKQTVDVIGMVTTLDVR